jgi:arabinogalactan oligomer/maltooligosaccharide transport system substrate-binding protein
MRLQSLLLLVTTALLATACGKSTPAPEPTSATQPAPNKADDKAIAVPTTPSPTVAPQPVQTVTLWHSYRDDERRALDELVAAWNQKHAEVQVTALAVPYDAFIDKVQVAVPNGNGPDLVIIAHDKIGTWARDGIIQPLGTFGTPARLGRFLPQTVKPLVFEKALYGLPLSFKSLVLFYNKKMVKAPPNTLAQLVAVAKGFTDEKNEAYGLAYDASDLYFHAAFLHAAGGKVWDDATHKLTIDTPEAVKAIETVRNLYKKEHILPKGVTGFMVTAMFNDGKTPFVLQGPWFVSEIAKGVDWGVAVLPTLDDGKPLTPFLGSEALLLTKPTKVRDAALAVIDYLTSDEAALTRLEHGHQIVANTKIYENPRWLNDPVVKVFRAQAEHSLPMPTAVEPGVAWTPYNTALRKAIFGDAKPAEALAEAQRQADEAVAKLGH